MPDRPDDRPVRRPATGPGSRGATAATTATVTATDRPAAGPADEDAEDPPHSDTRNATRREETPGDAASQDPAPAAPAPAAPTPSTLADPTPSGTPGAPDTPGTSHPAKPRPADLAREALRAARRARTDLAGQDDGAAAAARPPAGPVTPATAAPAGGRTEHDLPAGLPGTGDKAPPSTAAAARSAVAATRSGRGSRDRVAGPRARDVRALLADAFRMPASADEPEEAPAGRDGSGRGSVPERTPRSASPATAAPGDPAFTGTHPHPHSRPHPAAHDARETATPGTTGASHRPAPAEPGPPPPATPRMPRTMATPDRDNDLRRTFPAFPPRASDDRGFAETWWGNAWVAALEEGALDAKRLARGRGYAEQGNVDAITVTPGLVLAYVKGSRPRPYRVQVRLRTLDDTDWERFLDAAADRPGDIAALLDKEMPQSLADCGVPLLPGPGDLAPRCSCPDSGHPCKHAAALCYQAARLLDADPFVLFLLRGRGEREVLDTLSRRSAARAARAAREREPAPLPGVRATEVLARGALPPLPAPLPVPPHPEQPPVYPAAPGGPDPFALDQLATDAAARAHALLTTGRDPVGRFTLWQDAVRLAAGRPGSGLTAATRALYASLASAAGRTPAELARAVAAWRQGGPEGLTVLEEAWDPPAGRFDRARPLLLAADLPAFRPWRNRLTHPRGHLQLRLGRDGLWYAYESEPGHDDWWPRGTPDLDPVGALTGLGVTGDL
ncbi:SWIM zinc finger family protein [Streptomyces sp. NPDC085946]|uniref:SWIM zinc finger family protein n=1 Tax=Streptomyces sp. NPDC085946 TaxID=3365744 RepID=UPI0037D465B1